jgi:hypothetical protein
VTHGVSLQTALNLDPFMIHETFLSLTESAFGSHPCRVVSVTYRKLRPFHGGNTGSNPVGDATKIKDLTASGQFFPQHSTTFMRDQQFPCA